MVTPTIYTVQIIQLYSVTSYIQHSLRCVRDDVVDNRYVFSDNRYVFSDKNEVAWLALHFAKMAFIINKINHVIFQYR